MSSSRQSFALNSLCSCSLLAFHLYASRLDFIVGGDPGAVDLGENVLVGDPALFHVGVEGTDERADRVERTIEVGKGVEVDDTKVGPAIEGITGSVYYTITLEEIN